MNSRVPSPSGSVSISRRRSRKLWGSFNLDNEDKQRPKSDEQLVKDLAEEGITVARRTVTKYRKSMKIPSSRQRRDWLKKDENAEP